MSSGGGDSGGSGVDANPSNTGFGPGIGGSNKGPGDTVSGPDAGGPGRDGIGDVGPGGSAAPNAYDAAQAFAIGLGPGNLGRFHDMAAVRGVTGTNRAPSFMDHLTNPFAEQLAWDGQRLATQGPLGRLADGLVQGVTGSLVDPNFSTDFATGAFTTDTQVNPAAFAGNMLGGIPGAFVGGLVDDAYTGIDVADVFSSDDEAQEEQGSLFGGLSNPFGDIAFSNPGFAAAGGYSPGYGDQGGNTSQAIWNTPQRTVSAPIPQSDPIMTAVYDPNPYQFLRNYWLGDQVGDSLFIPQPTRQS